MKQDTSMKLAYIYLKKAVLSKYYMILSHNYMSIPSVKKGMFLVPNDPSQEIVDAICQK